jgi:hypothetical protein
MKKIILLFAIVPFFIFSFAQNKDKGGLQKSTSPTNAEEKLGKEKYVEICTAIYQCATKEYKSKKLTVYTDNSMSKVITPSEILQKGGMLESIQMADPYDSNMIIDTVFMTPFTPDQTAGIRVVQNILKSDNIYKYTAEMIGISLSYHHMEKDKYIGEEDLFFVKLADLKGFLDEKTYTELVNACLP